MHKVLLHIGFYYTAMISYLYLASTWLSMMDHFGNDICLSLLPLLLLLVTSGTTSIRIPGRHYSSSAAGAY
jgi:hypothetical protein